MQELVLYNKFYLKGTVRQVQRQLRLYAMYYRTLSDLIEAKLH